MLGQLLATIKALDTDDMNRPGVNHKFKHLIITTRPFARGVKLIGMGLMAAGYRMHMVPRSAQKDWVYGNIPESNGKMGNANGGNGFILCTPTEMLGCKGKKEYLLDKKFHVDSCARPTERRMMPPTTKADCASRPGIFNAWYNNYGQFVRICVLDYRLMEGLDLYDIRYVHLFGHMDRYDEVQAIGRATRYCGSSCLEREPASSRYPGWPLTVIKYRVDSTALDTDIKLDKPSKVEDELTALCAYTAVDRQLVHWPLNPYGPNVPGGQPASIMWAIAKKPIQFQGLRDGRCMACKNALYGPTTALAVAAAPAVAAAAPAAAAPAAAAPAAAAPATAAVPRRDTTAPAKAQLSQHVRGLVDAMMGAPTKQTQLSATIFGPQATSAAAARSGPQLSAPPAGRGRWEAVASAAASALDWAAEQGTSAQQYVAPIQTQARAVVDAGGNTAGRYVADGFQNLAEYFNPTTTDHDDDDDGGPSAIGLARARTYGDLVQAGRQASTSAAGFAPAVQYSDIEASRSAGIMNTVKNWMSYLWKGNK
jgi:hypothetical protein